MSARSINTVIGENSTFKGDLSLQNSIEIKGTFEGNIQTTEDVLIREDGIVKSNIKARNVLVEGQVEGNIYAEITIHVKSKAQIKGDISSTDLQINRGASALCKILIKEEIDQKTSK